MLFLPTRTPSLPSDLAVAWTAAACGRSDITKWVVSQRLNAEEYACPRYIAVLTLTALQMGTALFLEQGWRKQRYLQVGYTGRAPGLMTWSVAPAAPIRACATARIHVQQVQAPPLRPPPPPPPQPQPQPQPQPPQPELKCVRHPQLAASPAPA